MHVFVTIAPKLLDLIESLITKKEKEVQVTRKVDNNKMLLKQSSFIGSLSSIKGMLSAQSPHNRRKSDLRFATDTSNSQKVAANTSNSQKVAANTSNSQNKFSEDGPLNQTWNDFSKDPNLTQNLIDAVKAALCKVDENPVEALELLNFVVIPDLEQNIALQFKPGTRTNLLANLLARIIDKITVNRPLALLVDDIQW
jgi:hypothetical protein